MSKEEQIALAQSAHLNNFIKLLELQKSSIPSLIGDNEYKTLINALTLEIEASLIGRFVSTIENIKQGNIHEI